MWSVAFEGGNFNLFLKMMVPSGVQGLIKTVNFETAQQLIRYYPVQILRKW